MSRCESQNVVLLDSSATLADNPDASMKELRADFFSVLLQELNPVGFAETMLARDLSRRGAQMVRDEQLVDTLDSQMKHVLAALDPNAAADNPDFSQAIRVRLRGEKHLEELLRHSRHNSEAFFRSLRRLTELQRDRGDGNSTLIPRDTRLTTETQCLAYLVRRFRNGRQGCRRCHQAGRGSWIAVRRCWPCASCSTQTCVRNGTVFARSPMPLVQWFHAVAVVLHLPNVAARDLATAIGVRRLPTVRSMANKIRDAIASDDATRLLAGLDHLYLPGA